MHGFFLDLSSGRWRGFALAVAVGVASASGAMACPDWQQTGQQLRYSADQLWAPQSFPVLAGGAHNLANCAAPGVGYVDARPHFDLSFTDNGARRDLVFSVIADCDTVMLINDASGQWSFNDDSDGLNPRIRLPAAQAGVYDIWVGTYSPTPCYATLTLETLGSNQMPQPQPQPSTAACPDPGQNGQMLTYDAGQLWQAQRIDVVAGGTIDLGACASVPGHGNIMMRPDFTLNLTGNAANHDLEFRAQASCDPVLLVNGADGQWYFNDDADGLNSRLRIPRARPGFYDIWVGTFGNRNCQASLYLETFGGQVAPQPPAPPEPPQPAVLPDPGNLMNYRDRVGQSVDFAVTGAAAGSVWGDGVYTDDSSLARAVVHAGVLAVGQSGTVRVTILPGQANYPASTRNGVQSGSWAAWPGSFRIDQRGADAGPASGRLIGVVTRSAFDYVSAGELARPSGRNDAQFRIALTAPGEQITAIEIGNTSGTYSVWDTAPGNAYWVAGVVIDGRLMNDASGQVSIPLGQGETVLDLFGEAVADQVADGRTGYMITVALASGRTIGIEVPATLASGLSDPGPGPGPGPSAQALIRVLSATYGANCGAPQGNVTSHIAAQCNGQGSCTYVVDYRVIGDPAVGCMKDYVVNYECGDGQMRTASVPPEAGGRRPVTLECPARTGAPPVTGGAIK